MAVAKDEKRFTLEIEKALRELFYTLLREPKEHLIFCEFAVHIS